MATNKCPACGKAAGKTAKFCKNCGASLDGSPPEDDFPVFDEGLLDRLDRETGGDDTGPEVKAPVEEPAPEKSDIGPEPHPISGHDAVPAADGSYTITVLNGGAGGTSVELEGEVVVGSSKDASLAIEGDDYVSSRHARFTVERGVVTVSDEGSSNGVCILIDGTHPLKSGDVVQIGMTRLRLERRG